MINNIVMKGKDAISAKLVNALSPLKATDTIHADDKL
jgi:hypothetical protein